MAQKKIEIIYDIDGKAIDVAIQSTLNLQQQAKALTAELRKTKEGTAEFTLLTSKLNDAKDGLDRVNAKSRDLFAALSLLPGPVGSFFGQLNGVIGLMKTFSSFSLKDLGFQFKELRNDLLDIYQNVLGTKKGVEDLADANSKLSQSSGDLTQTTKEQTRTLQASIAAYDDKEARSKKMAEAAKKENQTIGNLTEAQRAELKAKLDGAVGAERLAKTQEYLNSINQKVTVSFGASTKAGNLLGKTMQFVGFSFETAAAGVAIFETALMAIGIGVIIAALVGLFEVVKDLGVAFIEWADDIDDANKELKKINETIELTNTLLEMDEKSMKRRQGEYIAYLKSKGATEKQVREQGIKDLKDQLKLTQTAYKTLSDEEQKLLHNKVATSEDIQKLQKKRSEVDQKALDLQSQIKVAEYNNQTEINKKILEDQKKADEEAKKLREKRLQDNKTADEALITLKQENAVLYLKNERDKQYQELKNQAENEARKIEALDISEKKKEELRLQIYKKYGAKMIELANKFNEEDEKKLKEKYEKQLEWDRKLADMSVQAISDQTEREKAEKQKKYEDDLKDLKKALDDDLITKKEHDDAVLNLTKGLNNDLKKIDDDKKKRENEEKLKKLDDDIKFLQISTDAEKNSFIAYWDDRQKILDKSKERELAALDLTEAQKVAIEAKYVQLSKDLQKEKFNAYVGYVSAGLSAVSGFYSQQQTINQLAMDNELAKVKGNAEEEDKVKEKYFYKNRDAQKGQAIIATLQSAVQAYSSLAGIPIVGPFLGAAAAAAALVFGYKQVDLIASQTYQSSLTANSNAPKPELPNYGKNYGDGGMIDGPRHAQGGTLINAEGGEAVMTRGAVTMFQPLLSAMNQMGGGVAFSKGAAGQAGYDNPKVVNPSMTQPQIIKTYVVSNELTSEAQKQAKLKNLSTL